MGDTPEHIRPTGVHFYPIGLGAESEDFFSPRKDHYVMKHPEKKWKMRTLSDLMKELNHTEVIVYFKMSCSIEPVFHCEILYTGSGIYTCDVQTISIVSFDTQ